MQNKKITITISLGANLSDAICKAFKPEGIECEPRDLHQTIKASVHQEQIDSREGSMAYHNAEWRNQIGVMLG